jgi:hypothetical protein
MQNLIDGLTAVSYRYCRHSMAATSVGVEICFANPGTTELPLVQALDSVPGLRSILCHD